jgi:nucleoside-diphosphate-sugar epimerase
VTDVHDIGRVMGRIVARDIDGENEVLYVAGDTVSYGDLADIVGRVSGKEVEKEEWSIEYMEEEVKKDPEDGIKKYRLVFARDGVWWDKKGTVNEELGMGMMGAEEYARKLFGGTK